MFASGEISGQRQRRRDGLSHEESQEDRQSHQPKVGQRGHVGQVQREFLKTRFSRCILYRRNAAIGTD